MMKIIYFLLLSLICLKISSQDITVRTSISKSVAIENIKYGLTLYLFDENELDHSSNSLSKEVLLEQLDRLGIEFIKIENYNNLMYGSHNIMSSSLLTYDDESFKKLNIFLEPYQNQEINILSYDIKNEDLALNNILSNAIDEAKTKAVKIANQLNRDLSELSEVKLLDENNGLGAGTLDLNNSIRWTAYPPLSLSSKINNGQIVKNKISITKNYEFTFLTVEIPE